MKKILLALPIITLFSALTFGRNITPTFAEEESYISEELSEEEVSQELDTFESEETLGEKITGEINKFKDTYLIPLVSGVSLTSVISALITIGLSIYNRKTNSNIKFSNEETTKLAMKIIASVNVITEAIKNKNEIDNAIMNACVEQTEKAIGKIDELTNATEKMLAIREVTVKLVEVLALTISQSKEMVTNGIAEQVNELLKDLEKLK